MDISSLSRLRALWPTSEVKGNATTSADRDAQGHGGYESPPKPEKLTPEQEETAVVKLNALQAFVDAGLKAELVRGEEGAIAHVIVKDASGALVRNMSS